MQPIPATILENMDNVLSGILATNYSITQDRVTGTPIITWRGNYSDDEIRRSLFDIRGINPDFIILRKED